METIIKICSEIFRYFSCFALNVVLSRCSLQINITERFMNFKPFANFKDGGGEPVNACYFKKRSHSTLTQETCRKAVLRTQFFVKGTFYLFTHFICNVRLWINRYRMIFCDLHLSSQSVSSHRYNPAQPRPTHKAVFLDISPLEAG